MGEFPSGQRGQTVNLLAPPSVVRIHLPPFKTRNQIQRIWFFVLRERCMRPPCKNGNSEKFQLNTGVLAHIGSEAIHVQGSNPPSPIQKKKSDPMGLVFCFAGTVYEIIVRRRAIFPKRIFKKLLTNISCCDIIYPFARNDNMWGNSRVAKGDRL